jgi:N-acetylneuraminate lyase
MSMCFKGVFSALITPFNKSGEIDCALAERLVSDQLAAGVDGFFVCGSSGEGMLLANSERMLLAETVVRAVSGKAAVMVHAGHVSTNEAVSLARHAEKTGADAVSSLPPVFFNFGLENVICHYSAIAGATGLPFFAYLYPTVSSGLGIERTDWLERFNPPNLRGFKYTGSNLQSIKPFLERSGRDFTVFSGSDELFFQALTLGASGSVGTNQNIIPGAFAEIHRLFSAGKFEEAAGLQTDVNRLTMRLLELGLISTQKYILELLGYPAGGVRPPLAPLDGKRKKEIENIVETNKIILKYGLGRK